jgi:cytidylate kinase
MIRTQISFDDVLYERAKRIAKRQGVSLAELCRRSVAEVVARDATEHGWMKYVGSIDGELNDSSSVDDIVYGRESL